MRARPLIKWLVLPPLIIIVALAVVLGAAGPGRDSHGASASSDPTVIATIPVGYNPYGVAVNATTNRIYVSNKSSNNVSVISGATNTVIATVPVGYNPYGVAVNAATNRIYEANYGSNNVSVIDGGTNTVVATVSVGWDCYYPVAVAVNPATNRIYVPIGTCNNVSVIDGATNTVVATVTVGSWPYGVAVNPTTNLIYVTNNDSNSVSVIDGGTNTVVATVPVGWSPQGVAVNPTINRIYVANYGGNNVWVIDGATNTVVATVPVGSAPTAVAVNPATNRIYVANGSSNSVSVIDGGSDTVVANVPLGHWPSAVAVNATTNRIYVTNSDYTVSVIEDAGGELTPTATPTATPTTAPTATPTATPTCIPSDSSPTGISTCNMLPGDVLLSHTTLSGIYVLENLAFKGYWTHAGIYLSNNEIVESTSDGVKRKLIIASGFPNAEDWAILRPKSPTSDQRASAAQWAATQEPKPYNFNYLNPYCTTSPEFPYCADSYYCSQLVWQAYRYEGFDIAPAPIGTPIAVSPDALYNTSTMNVIDQRGGLLVGLKRVVLRILSPADLYVTDPQGRHVGVDPQTGATVNEIPGVFFSGAGTEPEFMSIPDMDGTWQARLVGTGTGSYTFTADIVDPNGPVETSVSGTTSVGQVDSYSLSYPGQAGQPIAIEPASSVGGIAELPEIASAEVRVSTDESGWSAGNYAALAGGLAAALLAAAAGAWYARKRWLRHRA